MVENNQSINEFIKKLKTIDIGELLEKAQTIKIEDLRGDGDHYAAFIETKEFIGKTKVKQHQMVYQALEGKMGNELHALALNTSIPIMENEK